MKSIGTRLAFWYAFASTATLACLFFAGRYFLERHTIHGLDLLNQAEFEQIKIRLGPDLDHLPAERIRAQMNDVMMYGTRLFFIEIRQGKRETIYRSLNLAGQPIPEMPGATEYNALMAAAVGELRVGIFQLGPLTAIIASSKAQVREVMVGYRKVFYQLLAGMFVVSAIVGYGLSRMALRPVRLIQATATQIGSDNLSERIPVSPIHDEISNLARLLNAMFDRLEAAFNQTRRFTAEASHELKTPLSLVRLQAEKLIIEGGLKPAQEEAVLVQLEEISRLNQIIEDLLFLSRAEARAITLQTRRQSTQRFLESFAGDARVLVEDRGLSLEETLVPVGDWEFDAKWLRQVLLNLVANALNFSPAGGRITLRSACREKFWQVSVEDEGPGVPADQRERIFERFVRLNADGTGSGLGLAISRSIVLLHAGRIRAEAGESGRGLKVIFELPAGKSPARESVS